MARGRKLLLWIDNSNVIELRKLTNSVTGVADTGATVTVTLQDPDGVNVSGQTWPATLLHDADGTYRVTLEDDLVLEPGGSYVAVVDVIGTGGEVAKWETPVQAHTRIG